MVEEISELVKCPCCKSEQCIIEKDAAFKESRLCMTCGMTTQAAYKFGSKELLDVEKRSPKIVKQLKFKDVELEQYWYPSTIQIRNKGMIYPIGNKNDWKWAVAHVIGIPLFERMDYPIPGKEGEYYETKLDVENASEYDKDKFLEACRELEMVKVE
jgi:hypothetical protein|tara:strand:- start:5 stop:475 length:471 start_codon:yes stop_codon:yes gene_type:complete